MRGVLCCGGGFVMSSVGVCFFGCGFLCVYDSLTAGFCALCCLYALPRVGVGACGCGCVWVRVREGASERGCVREWACVGVCVGESACG